MDDAEDLVHEHLQRAYELAGIGTYEIDLARRIIRMSREMARLLRAGDGAMDWPLDEYRQRFLHPEDRDAGVSRAQVAYASGAELAIEVRMIRGDGQVIWIRNSSSARRGANGESIVVGVTMDITATRAAQEALATNEALLRQFIRHTPAAIAMFDRDLRYLHVSERWISDYKLDGQDVVGRRHYDVFPDIPDRWKDIHRRVLAGAVERCDEDPFPRADGTVDWLEWECRPWHAADGTIHGMIMLTQVITERKRSEERLRESERRFRALSENAPTGIYIRQGNALTYANPAFERIFGYQRGEALGSDILSFVHPEDLASVRIRMGQRVDGVPSELRGIRKDGATIHVEILGFGMEIDGSPVVVGNVVDTTERALAEQRLRESEARFRHLLERSLTGVYIAQDDKFVYANPSLEQIFGAEPGTLVGSPMLAQIDPDEAAMVAERVRQRVENEAEVVHYEVRAFRRDGTPIWLEILGSKMDHGGRPALFGNVLDVTARKHAEARFQQIAETIGEVFWLRDPDTGQVVYVSPAFERVWGRPLAESDRWPPAIHRDDRARIAARLDTGGYDETYRIVRADGSVRWIRDRAYQRVVGTASDVTEQQALGQQLQQSQKMEAIGVLAGGVAHDFNNLLAVILSYAALVMADLRESDPMFEDLQEIRLAAERAGRLTHQLLAFSRRQVFQPHVVDLNEVVASTEKMLRRLIGEDVDLEVAPSRRLAKVNVDVGQMEQVLLNLAVNARDAMPAGGRLQIAVTDATLAEVEAARLDVPPGRYVILAVTDSGVGMDEATQARIFEPFFTTKEVGKGTGLGLSTVFGIVKQSGGHIAVESEPGRGTTFRTWLPFVAGAIEPTVTGSVELEVRGGQTILVVEDDDAVRRLVRTILTRRGFRVLEARSGGDALLICESHDGAIDLVLTDMVMPLMSGDVLVDRVRAMRPRTRALFMSGYPDKAGGDGREAIASEAFLQKPFTPDTLLQRVAEVLAEEWA